MVALLTVETVVLAMMAVLVAGLLRSHAEILRRLHDLGSGLDPDRADVPDPVTAPLLRPRHGALGSAVDVSGTTPGGEVVAIGIAGSAHKTLLAFLSSGCTTCHGFWSGLAAPGASVSLPGNPRVVVVTRDPSEESPAAIGSLAPAGAAVVMSSRAWADYGVPGSPYFVFADGPSASIVGEGTARTWDQLADLVGQASADSGGTRRGAGSSQVTSTSLSGRLREARADAELSKAGIHPGDPSLHARGIGEVFPGR